MVNTLHEQLLARIAEDSDGCEGTSAESIINAARAVVELHAPFIPQYERELCCEGCDWGLYADGPAAWPCKTIDAIASALGVETAE